MTQHSVVDHETWLEARRELLEKEKQFTRARDALAEARRALPWERVDTRYVFEGSSGKRTLEELFEGRSQLIVYHFMFAPEWEVGCKSCSFWADNFNGIIPHLNQRDVSFVAISRAPREKLVAQQRRMGWSFEWLSSGDGDFNYDFQASFREDEREAGKAQYNYERLESKQSDLVAISVFYRDESGAIYHTYSCYSRGVDMLNTAYHYLDLVPKGRDEAGLPYTQSWVKLRDEYPRKAG
jgi:predicted dithiol-disulfide oxidoreductase (DUF899 family)